jgi:hypothetical protein
MDFLARRGTLITLVLGIGLAWIFYELHRIEEPALHVDAAWPWMAGAFAVYFLVLLYVGRFWGRSFVSIEILVGFAVVFRVIMLFSDPHLSDDLYRYIWDGKVGNYGINPYRYEPQSDLLTGLRDDAIYPSINHKDIPTIYPPVAQWIFRGVTWISLHPIAMKTAMVIFDIGIIFILIAMLRQIDRALSWVVAYAWNPLVVTEFAGSGHMDSIGIFFMMAAILIVLKARSIWAAGVMGLAFATKMAGAPLLLFFEDVRHRWKTFLFVLATFVAVVVLAYWPFLDASDRLFTALVEYSTRWEFNGFLYSYVKSALTKLLENDIHPTEFLGIVTENKPRLLTKLILGAGFVSFLAILLVRHYRKNFENQKLNVLRAAYLLTAVLLLVSPTLHPWYVIWVVPFLCFYPNPGWFIFSGLVLLAYSNLPGYRSTGVWREDDMILLVQYVPFYTIFLFFVARSLWRKRKAHPSEKAE